MGNEEETAPDLEPRLQTDTKEFCSTPLVSSILDGLHRNKLDGPYKGTQLSEPHVMHRNPAGKRERSSQKIPRKSETAADIPVVEHIPPETDPHVKPGKERVFRNLFDIIHHITVECHEVWSGRRLGKSLPDHRHLVVEPDVILIGKNDNISPRLAQGVFKVEGRAEKGIAGKQANAMIGEGTYDFQRPIGRGIVGDHHLIVRRQLGKDRLHLTPDEALAVAGCHADGDAVGSQWSRVDSFKP
jgi:hypothetical protein